MKLSVSFGCTLCVLSDIHTERPGPYCTTDLL